MLTRDQIARDAADALERPDPSHAPPAALVGFDGFVDTIAHLVATRRDMSPPNYERIRTIPEFAARCAAAAGRSTNIERVEVEHRFGGNGPLMAGALARLGVPTTFVGAVGAGGRVEPIFEPFASRCRRVIPIGPSSHTLCLEFDDGKIMLNETSQAQRITWEGILAAVGLDGLRRLVNESSLLAIVNWSLLGGVGGIWRGLAREVLPKVSRRPRTLYVDLSDPAKRRDEDLRGAMSDLAALQQAGLRVVLGLNLAEAARLGAGRWPALDAPVPAGEDVRDAAVGLRAALGFEAVVIHPRHGAAAATVDGRAAWFDGPLAARPKLSTGAGDHFNAGFAAAWARGLALEHSLALGCAASGYYVRQAASPDLSSACAFLRALPAPELT